MRTALKPVIILRSWGVSLPARPQAPGLRRDPPAAERAGTGEPGRWDEGGARRRRGQIKKEQAHAVVYAGPWSERHSLEVIAPM